ncbi:MAG: response regulator transcription factor [Lachnospiraceae bacterium]|nr:response regulator transcription factor [Lachnospiraceae bacterium]
MSIKILLLEDDASLAMGIEYSLKSEGYEVTHISTFNEGKEWLGRYEKSEDIVGIFDVMLPDGNGFELLKLIREQGVDFPVVFLTAVSDETNIVQGLDIGADDYITKPFHVKELMSRLKAVIRRYRIGEERLDEITRDKAQELNPENADNCKKSDMNGKVKTEIGEDYIYTHKDLIIDTHSAAVYKITGLNKEKIELTHSEYKLLLLFLCNKNIVLERNVILNKIFDSNGSFVDDNTLSVYIKRLRIKLGEEYDSEPYIKTVRGIGYIMEG